MNIKAVIQEQYDDMEIHVCHHTLDQSVSDTIRELDRFLNLQLPALKENGDAVLVHERDIIAVCAEGSGVFLHTASGRFTSTQKLYELEEQLDAAKFFRVSRSEIINLKKITRLDMSLTGTIRVILSDDSEYYTSRRRVTQLKKLLGV